MASHNELGKEGETIAQQFIETKGFKILDCNWRHLRYEVDIIALDKDFLVFVEVKTRSTLKFGFPDESVDYRKEKMLIEAAEIYLEKKDRYNEVRFDIVSVVKNERAEKIYHIVDAFQG
jgi:putative endonuclease